ncbi:YSIRK-type signal peptide-containing protein [Gemelliphila palaticanis]|uniref:YSIRK-type signal peptide-containing protein n=1 Tax=Gemelliphila palaticanis TaxID=81950 RepID=A0ABX2SXU1_9BACL|nr:YSIRK-type signal peptide-containing protein [Gemella palaticanis]MBF0715065.1 YSIRK-type signal peptide-containing protein [Gemella palaticanis]NYS46995.1 YSIRK-type signal peptide-containing protein [Gemella palaticanis]
MEFNKHERFSIRKFKVGVASALLGAFTIMLSANTVDIVNINTVNIASANESAIISGSAEQTKRQEVINELLAKLEVEWKNILANAHSLTIEEYEKAVSDKNILTEAIKNKINSTKDDASLNLEKNNFIGAISIFRDRSAYPVKKTEAKKQIESAYKNKKVEIASSAELSKELEEIKATALHAVESAEANIDVDNVRIEYVEKINSLKVLTEEDKKFEESKSNKIAELLKVLELKWKEVEENRTQNKYTIEEYNNLLEKKEALIIKIKEEILKASNSAELDTNYNYLTTPVFNFEAYIKPVVKIKAIEELNSIYSSKKTQLQSSEYLTNRLESLKLEAENKINKAEFNYEVDDLKNNYNERINSLSVGSEDKEKLNEQKDIFLADLLSKLELKWQEIESIDYLRTLEESSYAVDKKLKLEKNIKNAIKEANDLDSLDIKVKSYGDAISTLDLLIGEPKVKPNAIIEIEEAYKQQKDKLIKDFINLPKLETLKEEAIEAIKRANHEGEILAEKDSYKTKILKLEKSTELKYLETIEEEASRKRGLVSSSISITDENKKNAEREILNILTNFKEKITSKKYKNELESLLEKAKKDINNVSLRLNLPSITKEVDNLMSKPESLDSSFDLESSLLNRLRSDLFQLYKTQGRIFGDGTNFIGLNYLKQNNTNNNAIIRFYENYVYESIAETIISDIKLNLEKNNNAKEIQKIILEIESANKSYAEKLTKDYNNFGINTFELSAEKLDSVLNLFTNQIKYIKDIIPKLDNLNEKLKSSKNVTADDAKKILGLAKEQPKAPENQTEVESTPKEQPKAPKTESTPKEQPKAPENQPETDSTPKEQPKAPENQPETDSTPKEQPKAPENQPEIESTPKEQPKSPKKQPEIESTPKEQPKTPEKQPEVESTPKEQPKAPENQPETDSTPKEQPKAPEKQPEVESTPKEEPKAPENQPETESTPKEQPKTPENQPEVESTPKEQPKTPEKQPETDSKPKEQPKTPEKQPEVESTPKEQPKAPENQPEADSTPKEEPKAPEKQPETDSTPKENIINQELVKEIGDFTIKVIIKDSKKYDLKVNDVTDENKDFLLSKINNSSSRIKVFDLELLDFNNKNIVKTNKERTVKIVVSEDLSNKDVKIYYINKETGEFILIDSNVLGNTIAFDTNHFSSYGLVISDKKQVNKSLSNKKLLPNTGGNADNKISFVGLSLLILFSIKRKYKN